MECARCGADDRMLYSCRHCGRDYCSEHRYPRHGCVTSSDVGEGDGDGDDDTPQARRMDLDAPAPTTSDPPEGLREWFRRQTYPGLVVKTVLLAALFAGAFYGGLLTVLFV